MDVVDQLEHHKLLLVQWTVTWQVKVHAIPPAWPMPDSWGPEVSDVSLSVDSEDVGGIGVDQEVDDEE